ncbi:long chain acyl-CoA synthetase 7, peroxisomal-like isoform X1 [Prunus avium]|uniref:Long chain acyl-CoA synthetase 7, peroxisomal-like isoform X1 n=1 Tax=Prunus avium TaxID=42229 RepID=A0A6P5TRA1_PRUAV|nr:long chain acyl-CoA synthetase 7, peroxisomal-like isoform X1 [Prunus avium]
MRNDTYKCWLLLKSIVYYCSCGLHVISNSVHHRIANSVKTSGTLRERLFQTAYSSKKQSIMSGSNGSPIWDRLVFNKIKEKLGGRVRFMGFGASPLSPDVMDFLRVCFSCQVIEGYGMTETSCAMSMMDEGDNLSGHVWSPNPACCEFTRLIIHKCI